MNRQIPPTPLNRPAPPHRHIHTYVHTRRHTLIKWHGTKDVDFLPLFSVLSACNTHTLHLKLPHVLRPVLPHQMAPRTHLSVSANVPVDGLLLAPCGRSPLQHLVICAYVTGCGASVTGKCSLITQWQCNLLYSLILFSPSKTINPCITERELRKFSVSLLIYWLFRCLYGIFFPVTSWSPPRNF